jgi:hypothetical protein
MIKLTQLIPEVVRLNSVKEIDPIKDELAAAAQQEYDDWIQDENGHNEELGSGGICHLIADKLIDVLYKHNINRCQTVSSCHEQHVYLVGQFKEGIYLIDIPYYYYETGGGFTWKKIPNVKFDGNYIHVERLDVNPRQLKQYIDQMEEGLEYPLAGKGELQSYEGHAGWKGKIVWMAPQKFLSLCHPLPDYAMNDKSYWNLRKRMKEKLPIDFLVLKVDSKRKKVIGHEGRHRATVAKELGIEKVPVLIYFEEAYPRVPKWGPEHHEFADKAEFKPEWEID